MERQIQVGNLSAAVDNLILRQLFEPHGDVRDAKISRHFETGSSTGVGFVEMASEEGGTAAIAALNHREHCGHVLSVCWSESSESQAAEPQQMFGPMNMVDDQVTENESDPQ